MIPKFANPHLWGNLGSDADDLMDAGGSSDVEVTTSKRKLHEAPCTQSLARVCQPPSGDAPRKKKRRDGNETPLDVQDSLTSFRLLSSAGPPRIISIAPKPPPRPKTRPPDCEDNAIQADERMRRAQSVAVDFAWLDLQSQKNFKPSVQDNQKAVHMRGNLPDPHPAVMVTECLRHRTARRQALRPSILSALDSPHSLRATCICLPTVLSQDSRPHHKTRAKAIKKRSYERPSPAYWRPASNQRGKCVGYALGYPGSWSVRYEGDPRKRWYVRDTMRKAAFSG
ncbi:uncharacterized protein EDB91DRAFT_1115975 [Suillus paluster]|uniref:uncharacterized protein n=1 Tax=Suillus paluster TaxID=48578 RepID=UPI001B85EC17|nr:uncharacterized protein EDB91DRAFT_1115975 [Suillus paluster]KAG1747050.1 hypothetical protein EDB91DRAFT_1115975 [Suillus paluster]